MGIIVCLNKKYPCEKILEFDFQINRYSVNGFNIFLVIAAIRKTSRTQSYCQYWKMWLTERC